MQNRTRNTWPYPEVLPYQSTRVANKFKTWGTKWATCPILLNTLVWVHRLWFQHNNEEPFEVNVDEYSSRIHGILKQQTTIGWNQIFSGRFCQELSVWQETNYHTSRHQRSTKHHTGERWQVALIILVWEQWYLLWTTRNQDAHGADAETRARIVRNNVHREIRGLYDQRERAEPEVQALMRGNAQDHEHQPTWINRNWLRIQGPLVRTSIRRAQQRATAGVLRSITSYFRPTGS